MVSPSRFIFLVFALLATLVSVGVTHGLWTDRWVVNTVQETLELEKVPLTVGRWEGKAIQDKSVQRVFGDAHSYLLRRYLNQSDGTAATIMLTLGRPGPMLIKHLPGECYPSAGYEFVEPPKRFLSQSQDNKLPDEFWVATFKKTTDAIPVFVRIYWSWSATGDWQTPDRPRFTFARYPILYKLYVIQNIANENAQFEGAPVHDLIKELTNAMRGSVFASSPR